MFYIAVLFAGVFVSISFGRESVASQEWSALGLFVVIASVCMHEAYSQTLSVWKRKRS